MINLLKNYNELHREIEVFFYKKTNIVATIFKDLLTNALQKEIKQKMLFLYSP